MPANASRCQCSVMTSNPCSAVGCPHAFRVWAVCRTCIHHCSLRSHEGSLPTTLPSALETTVSGSLGRLSRVLCSRDAVDVTLQTSFSRSTVCIKALECLLTTAQHVARALSIWLTFHYLNPSTTGFSSHSLTSIIGASRTAQF